MRFKVRNIKRGRCQIWANERPGARYVPIASVRYDGDAWRWYPVDYYVLPEVNTGYQRTRDHCVRDCKRTALLRQAERAIAKVKERSDLMQHWHCPTRDALNDMIASMLFTRKEIDKMRERMGL